MIDWLFDICCKIMSTLGDMMGLTYKEVCVIFNVHVQGGIWLFSALTPIAALICKLCKQVSVGRILYLIFAVSYGLCCSVILSMFIVRYLPITEGFDVCVKDLRFIAKAYNTTYQAINIFIFIVAWGLSVGWNILIGKLIQKDKIILSFWAMVASSITLLTFIIRT